MRVFLLERRGLFSSGVLVSGAASLSTGAGSLGISGSSSSPCSGIEAGLEGCGKGLGGGVVDVDGDGFRE